MWIKPQRVVTRDYKGIKWLKYIYINFSVEIKWAHNTFWYTVKKKKKERMRNKIIKSTKYTSIPEAYNKRRVLMWEWVYKSDF